MPTMHNKRMLSSKGYFMSNIDLIGLSNGVNIMLRVGQIDVNQGRLTVADP